MTHHFIQQKLDRGHHLTISRDPGTKLLTANLDYHTVSVPEADGLESLLAGLDREAGYYMEQTVTPAPLTPDNSPMPPKRVLRGHVLCWE